jgi:ferredoxin
MGFAAAAGPGRLRTDQMFMPIGPNCAMSANLLLKLASPIGNVPVTAQPTETLMVCNCQRTMQIDGAALAKALGRPAPLHVYSELCRGQVAQFEAALAGAGQAGGARLHVACTQEAPLFREIADDKGQPDAALRFTNIRERAGWTTAADSAAPKMAALLAESAHVSTPARLTTLTSGGVCLVYGAGQTALGAAAEISSRLSVSVLLSDARDTQPPAIATVPIAKGRIRSITGRLGTFEIEVDGYAAVVPSSRGTLDFVLPRNGAKSNCDIILDLSGEPPLFPDSARRDGYLRADPARPGDVWKALLKATDLAGEFEKPMYVAHDAGICAHARSEKVGCNKCVDGCPTGAITPEGDIVRIDAGLCGGCGTCASVCPTGAASYSYPPRSDVLQRLQILLSTYRGAGGTRPILLLHDDQHGTQLIDALARHGAGLPVNVLPLALYSVTSLGHEVLASALALGAEQIVLLASPKHVGETEALDTEVQLTAAFLSGLGYPGMRVHLLATADPEVLSVTLASLQSLAGITAEAFSFAGSKRDIARIALAKLHAASPAPVDRVALPVGAPYGRIVIKTDGCTLCLACVGACPANALSDHPERPEVALTEAACVQCGVCVATCPEQVITLAPSYMFSASAFNADVLHTEEPFLCVCCSKPFGTKATINRVVEKLKGRHAMFQNEDQLRLIQMCDNCRIITLSEAGNDPYKLGARPRVITTDDYIAARAANKAPKTPDDFLT